VLLPRCFYLAILGFFSFTFLPAVTHAAQANFSWLPNTETNLTGYEIHYGTISQNYTTVIDVGLPEPVDGRVHATVDDLAEGNTYYFAAMAYDSNGNESDYSQEISYTVTSSEPSLPPVANDLVVNIREDTTVTDQLNVDNGGGLPLQYTVISSPFHGTLTVEDATGRFTFTPVPDFNGTDSFTFTAANDNGESNIANVEVVIDPVNDIPIATNSALATDEDITANGQLTADDPDGDSLSYVLDTGPMQGTAVINDNGSFSYTPAANTSGTDSFSFKVNDGSVDSAPATVTISINPVNNAPVAYPATFATQEDTLISGQLTADDPDGNTLTYTMATNPGQGTVSINKNGSFSYTPTQNTSGTDSFTFIVKDGSVSSAPATVTINISKTNDPPVAYPAAFSTQEDTVVSGKLLANDPDGDSLSFTIAANPGRGTASIHSNGSFTYAPAANASGTDSFSFAVKDNNSNSAPATVTITIKEVNDPPVAYPASYTTSNKDILNGKLSAKDPDGDPLTFKVEKQPSKGTTQLNSDGSFIYTPVENATGSDEFTFRAEDDEQRDSAPATVTINFNQEENPLGFEAGELDVDHNWVHVDFTGTFTDPVVIASLISNNDSEPCLVRIDSVSNNGFDLRLQEYGYLDGEHPKERVSFIVMEAGHHQLADGTQVEAGSITVKATKKTFDPVEFSSQFSMTPVVITSIASENEYDAVTTRIQNIDQAGFECKLQEQESNRQQHVSETVNYLAWEPSAGYDNGIRYEVATTGDRVRHKGTTVEYNNSFNEIPLVVADMQTTDGNDTSILRVLQVSAQAIEIMVEEEQSKNSEIRHTTENGGFIAILSE